MSKEIANPHVDHQNLPTRHEIAAASGRIVLQQFTINDVQAIFELIDRNRKWLSQHGDRTAKKYITAADVLESIAHPANPQRLRFGIRTQDGILVGSINLQPDDDNPHKGEVGYYLGQEGAGHGYATEAVVTLSEYAFDTLGYEELYAEVVLANEPSAHVLARAGYVERGIEQGKRIFVQSRTL